MSISHGLAKVEKLSLDELAPETMSSSTKRWGRISKQCPGWSRCNHNMLGLFCIVGMGIGGGVCTDTKGEVCQPPLGDPSPIRDFGILFGLWVLVALMGCQSNKENK